MNFGILLNLYAGNNTSPKLQPNIVINRIYYLNFIFKSPDFGLSTIFIISTAS
jgi:hypothetical protein